MKNNHLIEPLKPHWQTPTLIVLHHFFFQTVSLEGVAEQLDVTVK